MSDDYDRLRADLEERHKLWVRDAEHVCAEELAELLERHPARDEVETVLNMSETELAEHYRQNGEDMHEVAQKTRKLILDAVERHESDELPHFSADYLYWHCLQCGAHEPVEPTGGEEEHTLGDWEKCITCGDGCAHVVTLKLGAAYEQGKAIGMSTSQAWKRANRLTETRELDL